MNVSVCCEGSRAGGRGWSRRPRGLGGRGSLLLLLVVSDPEGLRAAPEKGSGSGIQPGQRCGPPNAILVQNLWNKTRFGAVWVVGSEPLGSPAALWGESRASPHGFCDTVG